MSFDDGDERGGFCFLTSTVGWRYIATHRELASTVSDAMWIQDVDRDGVDELILPESAQVNTHNSDGNDAIILTAYDRVERGFALDLKNTLALRTRLAAAYRKAQDTDNITADDLKHFRRAELALRTDRASARARAAPTGHGPSTYITAS